MNPGFGFVVVVLFCFSALNSLKPVKGLRAPHVHLVSFLKQCDPQCEKEDYCVVRQ